MGKVTHPVHGRTYYYLDGDEVKSWVYRSGCTTSSMMVRWGVLYEKESDIRKENKNEKRL